jgi:hypothetical protein
MGNVCGGDNLRLRSAVRFEGDTNIQVIASPQSTASVCGLKIRNMKYNFVGEGTYVSGLVFEAVGELVGSTQAASVLANFASSYIQVAALAANAAFSDDFEIIIYAPPTEELPSCFNTQKSCLPNPPAAKLRTMPAEDMMEVMQAFQAHRYEERLHRAMAHFRIALNSLQPRLRVLAAEHLFIATENPIEECLSNVILFSYLKWEQLLQATSCRTISCWTRLLFAILGNIFIIIILPKHMPVIAVNNQYLDLRKSLVSLIINSSLR